MIKRLFILAIMICSAGQVMAKPLVADLDSRKIEINSGFSGKDLLLFGARNDVGNIVLVVRGPEKDYTVRKKEKIAGIWVNSQQVEFKSLPGFYTIASSRPLEVIKNDVLLDSLNIGLPNILFEPTEAVDGDVVGFFKDALLENKQAAKLYPLNGQYGNVSFIGDTLFKSSVHFPETIPRGAYTAEVYLFSDGGLTSVQSTPIIVQKTGFDAFIYDLAYEYSFLYGVIAILIALTAGWLASVLFQKR